VLPVTLVPLPLLVQVTLLGPLLELLASPLALVLTSLKQQLFLSKRPLSDPRMDCVASAVSDFAQAPRHF